MSDAPSSPASCPTHAADSFVWGTATAAHQIEGSPDVDGKGPSVWDTFTHLEGKVLTGETGDVAADHYRRWESDLDLMAELGVNAYRFSVSWPRVVPDGDGGLEQRGLDFYDRLVDGMLARGIAPYATLFHWDLPQALEDAGGWLDRRTPEAFARYAAMVGERLGDRVAAWITLNEPFVHASYGYAFGVHAPGRFLVTGIWPVVHHQLLGHGLAVQALRAAGVRGGIGLTNNTSPVIPLDPASEGDRAAAEAMDILYNRQFWDPVLLGEQPLDPAAYLGSDLSVVRDGDADIIATPIDFAGVNYYNPQWVKAAAPDNPLGFEIAEAPRNCRARTSAGRCCPAGSPTCSWGCASGTATRCPRSTSPRTAPPAPTSSAMMAASTTPPASPTSTATCVRCTRRERGGSTCAATSTGPSPTTSNGRRASSSGSGSCTSTPRRRCAPPRTRSPGTAAS
jgi:beta-glucosidase